MLRLLDAAAELLADEGAVPGRKCVAHAA